MFGKVRQVALVQPAGCTKPPTATKKRKLNEDTPPDPRARTLFKFKFTIDKPQPDGSILRVNDSVPANQSHGQKIAVKPKEHACPHCDFKTSHGPALTSHMKSHRVYGIDLVKPDQHRIDGLNVTFKESMHSTPVYPGIPTDVVLCVQEMINKLERESAPKKKKRKRGSRGSSHRRPYSNRFKARVLVAWEEKERFSKGTPDKVIAQQFKIHKSSLSKYKDPKFAELIKEKARSGKRGEHRTRLKRKSKYHLMEVELLKEFDKARGEGRRTGPRWMIRTARKLMKSAMPLIADITKINSDWLSRTVDRYRLAPRRKTNTKRVPIEMRQPFLQRYFAKTRSRFNTEKRDDPRWDKKYGIYINENRLNVDQVPFGVHDPKTTYERKGTD